MDRPDRRGEIKVKRPSTVWPRIAGSLAGLLIGGLHLGAVAFGLATLLLSTTFHDASLEEALAALVLCPILAALLGATTGATLGATLAQREMKQRSSCWRTMLVAVVGMVAGVPLGTMVGIVAEVPLAEFLIGMPVASVFIVAGAVIGSGWKAKPADGP